MKTISELRAAYAAANDRVEVADNAVHDAVELVLDAHYDGGDLEGAIDALSAAQESFCDALDIWGPLYDQIKDVEGVAKPIGVTLQ
jgi:hypothetical protein